LSNEKRQKTQTREKTSQTGKGCPICGKPRIHNFRPFCSSRCRNIDLARWLDGSYAVPAVEIEDDDGEMDR
jgi:endogenous inhibitor of DNA gyrase (YacG/DUF329 family)